MFAVATPVWASSSTVPDWVRTAVEQAPASFPARAKAAVLLNETTYTVASDGRAVEHVRYVVKILRPQGRKDGYPVVWFDKDSNVLSMHVWSIDAAGHQFALKDNEITDFSPPGGGGFYDDGITRPFGRSTRGSNPRTRRALCRRQVRRRPPPSSSRPPAEADGEESAVCAARRATEAGSIF